MTTISPLRLVSPDAWFLIAFVVAAVGRDVVYEYFLESDVDGLVFALLVCASILGVSSLWLIAAGQVPGLWVRLKTGRGVVSRAMLLGPMTAVVYGVTFVLIADDRMGAGLFNLVDGGLVPILTAAIGILAWREPMNKRFVVGFAVYLLGMFALFAGQSQKGGLSLVALASLSPICTAGSYGLQKWLLEPGGGGLTYAQVLFVRFLPASVLVWAYIDWTNGSMPGVDELYIALPVAASFGVAPVILLCSALSMNSLKRFSAWFFVIPAGTYLLTLPLRPDNQRALPICGALLILVCIIVMEMGSPRREVPEE